MLDYRSLQIWQRSHQLTLQLYGLTKNFPREELFGLVSQMRRAAASIPTNIAEGCGRNSDAELARFLTIASGSASELDYQLLLSHELQICLTRNGGQLRRSSRKSGKCLLSSL
ncbi:four helix bundle protein [Hymenobacter actinosclerus]|uniref:four helix bundle protein n=1 Tax=Hymenobacter actinosclerus TaxID=82805 RepID=UPI000B8A348A|nr:four helix bundle protein [Hymenobacter actinosclerus]